MRARRLPRFLQRAALLAPLTIGLAGCESLDKFNPFVEKQEPLPGERVPLFPGGVPGVDFSAPPPQPPNSNIPIAPALAERPQSQDQVQVEQQPLPPQPAGAPRNAKGRGANDAWEGTR